MGRGWREGRRDGWRGGGRGREERRKARDAGAGQQAKQKEADAAEAAKLRQVAAFKKYEKELALPMRERRTGRYRPEPVKPEGYTPDWNKSDS